MDAKVKARYFRVSAKAKEAPADFSDLLLEEMKKSIAERERDITGTGVLLRVEGCATDGDCLAGQFCRKQMSNIPPQAGPDGLAPIALPDGQGLGHLAAFRFHVPTRILLLQQNALSASTKRISLYLAGINKATLFTFAPVLREDAIQRFKNKQIRSFTVGFASTQNLEALDDDGIASAKGARLLAEAFKGFNFRITVSAGRGKKHLLDYIRVKKEVDSILGSDADVTTLEVLTKNHDDPAIDFLGEHMNVEAELNLPEKNPGDHYEVRRQFLKTDFQKQLPYLIKHFGPKG